MMMDNLEIEKKINRLKDNYNNNKKKIIKK